MKTVVFQGDSITDACTVRDDDTSYGVFGCGYPLVVAARVGYAHPGKYKFINKGLSGDRITDLYARITKDCIDLKPDILTILIGVNDVWHEFLFGTGVDNDKYYDIYCRYIEEVRNARPECEIYILETFVLKGVSTEGNWDIFRREVEIRAQSAKKAAEKYNLKFIPLQEKFDNLVSEKTPAEYWLSDGVHPTAAGHGFIAEEVIKALENQN